MKNLPFILLICFCTLSTVHPLAGQNNEKPRVIATTDGEVDDQCSMVRFLLYANEWDIEGIVKSSSQYHAHGHDWAGDDWVQPYLNAYAEVYPNLVKHDSAYPSPAYLRSRTRLGNVEAEGTMNEETSGSQLIAGILLDESDDQPVWLQAWGGPNTIARALKTIEEEHPEKMEYVANKIRFFFIWEQDSTYQAYIRPHWGKYNIPTVISDQFMAIAYFWDRILPPEKQKYFEGEWMKSNILKDHGPLCAMYKAKENGDFRSEGDSPSYLHTIPTGLRSMESPGYGGWGGRYKRVRGNTWLDPVPEEGYQYPKGRWYTETAWGRTYMRKKYPNNKYLMREYFKPMWRWTDEIQNDFAARADWCVKSYQEANHQPVVKLNHELNLRAKPGSTIQLSAKDTYDPDGDQLTYHWWHYKEADDYEGEIEIKNADTRDVSLMIPNDINQETTLHIVCEVKDNGTSPLTRYRRVIIEVEP